MSRTLHNEEKTKMIIKNKVILITGANGGIGKCLVQEFLKRGAAKIYSADLNVKDLISATIVPIKLDVTSAEDIAICRASCSDVNILINNAGVEIAAPVFSCKSLKGAKLEMDVNCLGLHALTAAFWDLLLTKESAVINMLSIASFINIPNLATYCASKRAAHAVTEAFRYAASNTNIKVVGVYPGYVDTNMTKNIDIEKATPESIVNDICDDFENGQIDIFPDTMSKELSNTAWPQNHTLNCQLK